MTATVLIATASGAVLGLVCVIAARNRRPLLSVFLLSALLSLVASAAGHQPLR